MAGKSSDITQPNTYFNSIDGLRLLASLNIVLFHLEKIGGLTDMGGEPGWLFVAIKGPLFHASLFFMLAGFLFMVKYLQYAGNFSTLTLIRGRLRDLYPLHFLTAVAMTALMSLTPDGSDTFRLSYSLMNHLGLVWSFLPFYAFGLNQPSWALSAFFLCYFFFGPALKRVAAVESRGKALLLICGCLAVPAVWWLIYIAAGSPAYYYTFFHVFAPVRLFEFFLGMALARLYLLNNARPRKFRIQDIPLLNDLILLACFTALFVNFQYFSQWPRTRLFAYHVFAPALYSFVLYRLARGNGVIAAVFALKPVRALGKSSLYPYLLHIPLASWLCWTLERWFGYNRFLHAPVNIVVFTIVLYAAGFVYWYRKQKRRKPTYAAAPDDGDDRA